MALTGTRIFRPARSPARVDRPRAGRDLAEAVVPHLREGMQVDLGEGGADVIAELAVDRGPHLVLIGKGKAHCGDGADRRHGRDDHRAGGEHVDAAAAHLREHVGVAAELVVGEDLDLDAAVGLGGDALGRLGGADVQRMAERQVVGVFQHHLSGMRRGAAAKAPGLRQAPPTGSSTNDGGSAWLFPPRYGSGSPVGATGVFCDTLLAGLAGGIAGLITSFD